MREKKTKKWRPIFLLITVIACYFGYATIAMGLDTQTRTLTVSDFFVNPWTTNSRSYEFDHNTPYWESYRQINQRVQMIFSSSEPKIVSIIHIKGYGVFETVAQANVTTYWDVTCNASTYSTSLLYSIHIDNSDNPTTCVVSAITIEYTYVIDVSYIYLFIAFGSITLIGWGIILRTSIIFRRQCAPKKQKIAI